MIKCKEQKKKQRTKPEHLLLKSHLCKNRVTFRGHCACLKSQWHKSNESQTGVKWRRCTDEMTNSKTLEEDETAQVGRQVRVIFSGGINPASPRALRATLPLGRMVSQVMLPLFRPIRSHPSGGNCRALPEDQTAISAVTSKPEAVDPPRPSPQTCRQNSG